MDLNTALNFGLFKYSWSPKFAGPIGLTLNQLRPQPLPMKEELFNCVIPFLIIVPFP